MASYDKKGLDAKQNELFSLASSVMDKTGETGNNTGLALETEKKGKVSAKKIGEAIKEDPKGTLGSAASEAREPLSEYRQAQRQKQAVPKADELASEPVNLMEAFNI